MTTYWLNGEIVPPEKASVSVLDHGLLYGDGVFEGIRFYNEKMLLAQQHLERLFDSAAALLIHIPYDKSMLLQALQQIISCFEKPDGYLRLVVTRGVGKLGIDISSCKTATVFIVADQLQVIDESIRERGIRVMLAATQKVPNACWDARIKSLNYLNNVLARIEAQTANVDEAILLNQNGFIAEGAINNVFIVNHQELLTPPVSDGALNGITRQLIIQLAKENDISFREASLTSYDLYTADECFLSGTGVELIPVKEIDGRTVKQCPGDIFSRLKRAFANYLLRL